MPIIREQFDIERIEMNCYVICNIYNGARNFITNEKNLKINFVNISSCSAILFICREGYAGFHYGAQSLVYDEDKYKNKDINEQHKRINEIQEYRTAMDGMIRLIETNIGEIKNIYCYTPQIYIQLGDAYKRDVEEDEKALSDYFSKYSFLEVATIVDLYSIKNKNIPWVPQPYKN